MAGLTRSSVMEWYGTHACVCVHGVDEIVMRKDPWQNGTTRVHYLCQELVTQWCSVLGRRHSAVP